jgi:hypothetical protein
MSLNTSHVLKAKRNRGILLSSVQCGAAADSRRTAASCSEGPAFSSRARRPALLIEVFFSLSRSLYAHLK